jgi:hypothetical protein
LDIQYGCDEDIGAFSHTITTPAYISIQRHEPESLEVLDEAFTTIANLLSLLSGARMVPAALAGFMLQTYQRVEIIFPVVDPRQSEFGQIYSHYPMFIPHMEQMLSKWFTARNDLRPVHDLYFSSFYSPQRFVGARFLALAQAVESFHRRVHDGQYVDRAKHRAIVTELTNAIPKDIDTAYAESLSSALSYANEPRLRTRLYHLLDSLPSDVRSLIVGDPKRFAALVTETRNYLTHFSEGLREKAASGAQLHVLAQQTQILLECLLLNHVGVPGGVIVEMLQRNEHRRWLRPNGAV